MTLPAILRAFEKPPVVFSGLRLRLINPDRDVPYITNSWLVEHRQSPSSRGIMADEFFVYEQAWLEAILPMSTTLVLCNQDDLDQIVGYITYSMDDVGRMILHWVNIKGPFRKRGLASVMFRAVAKIERPRGVRCTYLSRPGLSILRESASTDGWRYVPYLRYVMFGSRWRELKLQSYGEAEGKS